MSKFESPQAYTGQKATEDRWGSIKIANSTEAADTTNNEVAMTPARISGAIQTLVPDATTTVKGKVELSTDAETQGLSSDSVVVTPGNLGALLATTTQAGIQETATDAETQALTATNKFVTPSNLAADGFLQWADVTLTSSEIKNLTTAQKTLVAAPAAGKVLKFMGAVMKLNYGGNNVFTESGDNLAVKFTDDSGAQVSQTIETTGFIDQMADTYTTAEPKIDAIVAAASAEAQALVLDNLGSNIAGNAADDNTITMRVFYQVMTL